MFAPQSTPNPEDDGLLQVREIRRLRLNASLVTLSACNTGVGPVGAAGVANIGEAFIESGALSVVSTLWELADNPSKRFMTEFYDHLAHNEDKGEALSSTLSIRLHSKRHGRGRKTVGAGFSSHGGGNGM